MSWLSDVEEMAAQSPLGFHICTKLYSPMGIREACTSRLSMATPSRQQTCIRQPFCRSEIGLPKSVVLANRLNLFWGLDWEGLPEYLSSRSRFDEGQIVIGCVDSSVARGAVREWTSGYSRVHYWLDLGNKSDGGQFVLGEPLNSRNRRCSTRLRTVAELFPEIADSQLPDDEPSCSAPEALDRQEPFVNPTLANHALALLARMFRLWSHLVSGRICELGEHGARATITD